MERSQFDRSLTRLLGAVAVACLLATMPERTLAEVQFNGQTAVRPGGSAGAPPPWKSASSESREANHLGP